MPPRVVKVAYNITQIVSAVKSMSGPSALLVTRSSRPGKRA